MKAEAINVILDCSINISEISRSSAGREQITRPLGAPAINQHHGLQDRAAARLMPEQSKSYARWLWETTWGGCELSASLPRNFCSISTKDPYSHFSARSARSSWYLALTSSSLIRCSAARS